MKTGYFTHAKVARATAVVAILGLAALGANAKSLPTPAQTANTTLQQIRSLAYDASLHSQRYAQAARNLQRSNGSRGTELEIVGTDLNRINRDLALLNAERPDLAAWQQEALSRVQPMANLAAAEANQAVAYFNAHRATLWTPANERNLRRMTDETQRISSSVHEYLEWGKLHRQESALEHKLPGLLPPQ